MSKMKSNRIPPLAKPPTRLRPRRVVRSTSASMETPPGSLTKSQKPIRNWAVEESDEIRPEYRSVSCELRALAKMVRDELRNGEPEKVGLGETHLSANSTPLFERGRLYDEYSARRNERIKKRKSDVGNESKTGQHLGVTIESSKRRESKKRESLRKSVSAACSMEINEIQAQIQTPRYQLRSMSKENKKPSLAVGNLKIGTERKTAIRRGRS